jgi:hypothetical protein
MQRRVKTYGRRSTRVVYIDDAFPPFQSSSLTAAVPSTSHSHRSQPAKPSTSTIAGLRKSSKAPVVLSESDSESNLSTNRKPLTQLSPNLRRPRGQGRGPDTAKPSTKGPPRRPARVIMTSSSSDGSDGEEFTQRKIITTRTSTTPSRLAARSMATSALRGSKPTKATQARRTAPVTCDLSSDEEDQTASATQAPTTSDSETEGSNSDAPARTSKREVSSRSPMYTRRIITSTIVLTSSSEDEWQGVPPSVDLTSPIVTGGYRLLLPHIGT